MIQKQRMKKQRKTVNQAVVIAAMCLITLLELWAMSHGHDGVILTMSIAAVAGIAGYKLRKD